jgi:hypothetical protein
MTGSMHYINTAMVDFRPEADPYLPCADPFIRLPCLGHVAFEWCADNGRRLL